jgi:hypothetical protein
LALAVLQQALVWSLETMDQTLLDLELPQQAAAAADHITLLLVEMVVVVVAVAQQMQARPAFRVLAHLGKVLRVALARYMQRTLLMLAVVAVGQALLAVRELQTEELVELA